MSNACLQNRKSSPLLRNKGHSSNYGIGVKTRKPGPAPATPLLDALPRRRREKVLAVRRQIAEGSYDLDPRMDAILDRLLKDLVA